MRHLLLFVAILVSITGFAQNPSAAPSVVTVEPVADLNAPEITFEAEVIDYGTIQQGSEAIRTFKFTNTGKTPLVIKSIKGQCGCTSIPDSWTKEPIPPGGTGTFQVKYDTATRVGMFDKKIMIISNAANSPKEVKIKGNVVAVGGQ
jgi:LEA14-like dessication related protein